MTMKKLMMIIIAMVMVLTPINTQAKVKMTAKGNMYTVTIDGHKTCRVNMKRKPKVIVKRFDKVSRKTLTTRKEKKIIILTLTGKVTNNRKDGRVFTKSKFNYISYRRVLDAQKGDIIKTYLIMNPHTNAEDDVFTRYDKIIR